MTGSIRTVRTSRPKNECPSCAAPKRARATRSPATVGHQGASIRKPFGVRRPARCLDDARVLLHPDEPPADLCHRVVRIENDHAIWTIQLLVIRFHFYLLQMELPCSSATTDACSPSTGKASNANPTHTPLADALRGAPTPGAAAAPVACRGKPADDDH